MIYALPVPTDPVTQGDILDSCPIFGIDADALVANLNAPPARWSERVIVLIQACDLAQSKTSNVLVALVHAAERLVAEKVLKEATIRDQIRAGKVFGW